jgi:hypothetical protein
MFDRAPHSEITTAPTAASASQNPTYPPDKKPNNGTVSDIDPSRAEMGDSDIDPKARDRDEGVTIDAVWGRIDANGPNYRNLGW